MLAPSLFLLEDDHELRGILGECLREEGFEVSVEASAAAFVRRVRERPPDALIIDVGLPDADGRDVCQALRAQGIQTPVLFLTARDALVDRLAGFSSGGDDYLTKPFSLDELIARLWALVRRGGAEVGAQVGNLRLDPGSHAVVLGDAAVVLTPTEFRILAALCASPGQAVRRRQLVRAAWPHGALVHDNTLDAYIARLRRKLRQLGGGATITTVRGVGYILR